MAVRLGWWTLDVEDDARLAAFYLELLGWERLFESEEGTAIVPSLPPVIGRGFLLYTDHTAGPKRFKNRAHLDLSVNDRDAVRTKALELGASPADIGQGDVEWDVLMDPEGNEFCILPGEQGDPPVRVEAWTLDANDVDRVATFWQRLLEWDEAERDDDSVLLRDPAGMAHDLLVLYTPDPKQGKNRAHPDLTAVGSGEQARDAEVARALELGASRVDIGQGDVPWAVLADPEGNEFCILRPPGDEAGAP